MPPTYAEPAATTYAEPAAATHAKRPDATHAPAPPARAGSEPQNPLAHLTPEQIDELGREFDAIRDEVFAELGESDARYIRSVIKLHRYLVLSARVLLLGSRRRPLWATGTAFLSLAKILENMEIGHNVMHGQWDWMNDPDINSQNWDWDTASPADAWRHSHNYEHHTFTNIRGKDRDLGYEIMRIDPHQAWHPIYLLQPLYNLVLMAFFEWGVAVHDLDHGAIRSGEKSRAQLLRELKAIGAKARGQILKDYIAFPALSGRRSFRSTLAANFTANIVRNVWAHSIIFCGHFPDQTYTFSQHEVAEETRGGWYVRQLLGAANIDGSPLFHLLSGNLSFQVEHHLYPDMPSSRYAEVAPRVRELCRRYGLPYNTGPLHRQLGSVHRTILRLAFPGGSPRPKPGPLRPS
ncbi:MAG: NADPH-dependent stearoyl-CoA 9-desaturase [Solirubrobacteraceae bacterium]|jgi:linoleoyl-CoA desaturase|nr:NADPH-dependent stearoyl-CoA 9-desaturase [Solirubrobacteraceae bacterium]